MISTNEFKTGITVEYEGDIYQVMEFQHVKPGKGQAFLLSPRQDSAQRFRVLSRLFFAPKSPISFLDRTLTAYCNPVTSQVSLSAARFISPLNRYLCITF